MQGGRFSSCCGRSNQHGIAVHGASDTLIERVEVRRVGGDCFGEIEVGDRVQGPITIKGSLEAPIKIVADEGLQHQIIINKDNDGGT